MKPQIIIASAAAFAAACNAAIQQSPLALEIQDTVISPSGEIVAMLVPTNRQSSVSGSIHTVTVHQGSAETAQKMANEMIEGNPHVRPLKLLIAPDADASKKKKSVIILILASCQP